MVKALLENRKTMTRRLFNKEYGLVRWNPIVLNGHGGWCDEHGNPVKMPYKEGDIIYVREKATFWEDPDDTYAPQWWYAADNEDGGPIGLPRWKPSIHMPKEAARIFLRVVEIRVERLQDISNQDSVAEGTLWESYGGKEPVLYEDGKDVMRRSFKLLWESIHGPDSWASNPWVKVIRFERVIMDNPWRK